MKTDFLCRFLKWVRGVLVINPQAVATSESASVSSTWMCSTDESRVLSSIPFALNYGPGKTPKIFDFLYAPGNQGSTVTADPPQSSLVPSFDMKQSYVPQ